MHSIDPQTARLVLVLSYLVFAGCVLVGARCSGRLLILTLATAVLCWERANPTPDPDRAQVGAENVARCLRLQARSTAGVTWDLAVIVVLGAALEIACSLLSGIVAV
jgi:hypothetical protein